MPYENFHWVTDRLAVGGFVTESGDVPFDAILSMEVHAPATIRELVTSGQVEYQWRSIIDGYSWETSDEIVRRFEDAAAQINEWQSQDKRVLVHCFAGVSRAVTAAITYLTRYADYTWDEALEVIQRVRPQANPNLRFEIPLRLAAGEDLTEEWLAARVEAYCRRMKEEYDFDVDPQQILDDLARQGTRIKVEAAPA